MSQKEKWSELLFNFNNTSKENKNKILGAFFFCGANVVSFRTEIRNFDFNVPPVRKQTLRGTVGHSSTMILLEIYTAAVTTFADTKNKSQMSDPLPIVDKDIRQDARSSRLSLKNSKEEDLRKILLKDARVICKDIMKEFADCAKEKGLMVVIQCRKKNQSSNAFFPNEFIFNID